ncbi:hypothetical protein DVH24_038040 [Malus domestica]|uniref:Uncharacterized protein n=1 Tax=Malus domestica TaxID=3750 RepID=A0A498K8R2_MALDO|nr:hypothetical protein DVH24_038040 [Malus domestica]
MVDSIPFSMSRFLAGEGLCCNDCLSGELFGRMDSVVVATGMDATPGCGAGRPLDHLVELPTGSDPGELLDVC